MCIYIYCYITYMLHCMYGVPHFESFMYDSPCTISQYDAVCIYIIYPKTRDSYDMTSSIYSTITIFRGLYIYIYLHMHILYCIFLYIEFTAGHSRAANLRPTTLRSPGSTNRKVGPWRPQLS